MKRFSEINDDKTSNLYLWLYVLYIVVITISKFTSYARYIHFLHPLYEITVIFFILVNLLFLLILKDSDGHKNIIDYYVVLFSIFIIILRFSIGIQIITMPLMNIYLFIMNLRYVNLKKFVYRDFKTKLFLVIIIFVLFLSHLMPSQEILHRNGLLRISGGFFNYNGFASTILILIFSYIIFKSKEIFRIRYILIITVTSLSIFLVTDSRGFLFVVILLILLLLISRIKMIQPLINKLPIISLIISSIFAIAVPFMISPESSEFTYYNKVFSNRLFYQHLSILIYPIKLFGHININLLKAYNNDNSVFIDNTYLMILLMCGIIGFLLFISLFIYACYGLVCSHDYVLSILFVISFIYMVVETEFFNISFYEPVICSLILFHLKNRKKVKI